MRDVDLRQRVLTAADSFSENSSTFKSAAGANLLHEISAEDYEIPGVSDSELVWLYTQQLARRGRPARDIYDAVLGSAPYGLCSYCQYGKATTLDHFVPKASVSGLAIDPWNLVPACKDCNHTLLDGHSDQADFQLLHPYFIPDLGRWLYADVVPGEPATLRFYVNPAADIPAGLRTRIQNQHSRLRLGELYAVVSTQDLSEISSNLNRLYPLAGAEGVRAHLYEMSGDCFRNGPNNRRGVVYEALYQSAWYCDGGFAE